MSTSSIIFASKDFPTLENSGFLVPEVQRIWTPATSTRDERMLFSRRQLLKFIPAGLVTVATTGYAPKSDAAWVLLPFAIKVLVTGLAAVGLIRTSEAVLNKLSGTTEASSYGGLGATDADVDAHAAARGSNISDEKFIISPAEAKAMGDTMRTTGMQALPVDGVRRFDAVTSAEELIFSREFDKYYRGNNQPPVAQARDVQTQYGDRGKILVGNKVSVSVAAPGSSIARKQIVIPTVVAVNGRQPIYSEIVMPPVG